MFGSRELWKFGFLDCDYCIYKNSKHLCHRKSRTCDFCANDWNLFISTVVTNMKACNTLSEDNRITRKQNYISNKSPDSDTTLLNWFYVQLINDCLPEIRKGNTVYVFSLYHIRDILRFEPDINVAYIPSANSFSVNLSK